MRIPVVRHLLFPALLLLPALGAAAAPGAGLTFEPCDIRGSDSQRVVEAECATFDVPADPADPDGDTLALFVARIPALTPEPAADAVTIINGGPGASSVSLYVDLEGALSALRRNRDVIVVDQRGTGRSAPLDCPALDTATYQFDPATVRAATRHCLDALRHDPRLFTTSLAVEDLERLRRQLGYRQWNLYGVSYGTRVAQHYLRRYPDAVRSVILDGVVPPDLALGPDVALNAQTTLDGILERCGQADYCAAAFPDPAGQFQRLRERLRASPVTLETPDPVTGRSREVTLSDSHLAMTVRLLSYAPETAALIPLVVHEADTGNFTPLAGQAMRIEAQLQSAISFGMHNSVVCTEDVPFYGDLTALQPALEAAYLGADQVRALETICGLWPRGVRHDDLAEPLRSDRPVLLLSGEFDPITPPAYAERAAAGLTRSRHLVAPGQGHGVIARGCVPQIAEDFIEAAAVDDLDTACLDRLAADPFFVDLLGPPP